MDRTEFIPLGGSVQVSDATAASSMIEQIQNFVPVIASPSIGGKKLLRMMKRRGYQNLLTGSLASSYLINEAMQWTGTLGTGGQTYRGVIAYAAWKSGAGVQLLDWDTSLTSLGTYGTNDYRCIGMQETLISGVANIVMNIAKVVSPYNQKMLFFPAGGSLTEVTDGDFPTTTIGKSTQLDGYCISAATDGYLYWSDVNSLSAYTSGNRIAVQMVPDSLVGTALIRNIVVALGTTSMEFFARTDVANPIIQRITQAAKTTIGVINGNAVQPYKETLIFVSSGAMGLGVYMLNGFDPVKISTAAIDYFLAQSLATNAAGPLYGSLSYAPSFRGIVKQHGVTGVVLHCGVYGQYIYWPDTNTWTTFVYGGVASTDYPFFFSTGTENYTLTKVSAAANSIVYESISDSLATCGKDYNAAAFQAFIQTFPLTHGTSHRKFYKQARLFGDIQNLATQVELLYSDNDGFTFTSAGFFEMGPGIGTHANLPITRLGSSRKRAWKLLNASAGGCVLDGLELTYEVGTN